MKNSIFLIAIGLILLTGCSHDESNEQITDQSIDSVYISNQIDGTTVWKTISRDELPVESNNTYSGVNGNVHTDGYFMLPSRDGVILSWTGTGYDSRFVGNAELEQSQPAYSFHFIMETECVTVDGNEAVYGGIITEVIEITGNPPPFGVNWRFYFKVIDGRHGGGSNTFDFISNTKIFMSPRSISLCNVGPGDPVWSSNGYTQVIAPGFVNVE